MDKLHLSPSEWLNKEGKRLFSVDFSIRIRLHSFIMEVFKTKSGKLIGTSLTEVTKNARKIYSLEKARTKRSPYIKSAYFKKDKIIIAPIWGKLENNNPGDRFRRLKYYACALELIRHSKDAPDSKEDPNNKNALLHRFIGISSEGDAFGVQIKENKKTNRKILLSVFPM